MKTKNRISLWVKVTPSVLVIFLFLLYSILIQPSKQTDNMTWLFYSPFITMASSFHAVFLVILNFFERDYKFFKRLFEMIFMLAPYLLFSFPDDMLLKPLALNSFLSSLRIVFFLWVLVYLVRRFLIGKTKPDSSEALSQPRNIQFVEEEKIHPIKNYKTTKALICIVLEILPWLLICISLVIPEFFSTTGLVFLDDFLIVAPVMIASVHPLYLTIVNVYAKEQGFFKRLFEMWIFLSPYFLTLFQKDPFSKDIGTVVLIAQYFFTTLLWSSFYFAFKKKS